MEFRNGMTEARRWSVAAWKNDIERASERFYSLAIDARSSNHPLPYLYSILAHSSLVEFRSNKIYSFFCFQYLFCSHVVAILHIKVGLRQANVVEHPKRSKKLGNGTYTADHGNYIRFTYSKHCIRGLVHGIAWDV